MPPADFREPGTGAQYIPPSDFREPNMRGQLQNQRPSDTQTIGNIVLLPEKYLPQDEESKRIRKIQ